MLIKATVVLLAFLVLIGIGNYSDMRARCEARGGVAISETITKFSCIRKDAIIDLKAAP
jgi:hypothetical protein